MLEFSVGGDETLILISSDLSHYHQYEKAQVLDRFASDSILQLQPDSISYEHTCGQVGVRGLLLVAQSKKLLPKLIDLRNSGDTFGTQDKVVGYGCFAFYSPLQKINRRQRNELTRVARASIDYGLKYGKLGVPRIQGYGPPFTDKGASFITLSDDNNKLRGCIGSLTSNTPLLRNVSDNAFKAAFHDGRFQPLTRQEWNSTRLEVSVLGDAERVEGDTEQDVINNIRPFIDGLILKDKAKRGTFLPAVWCQIPNKEAFLNHLKKKAGLSADYWSSDTQVYRYSTESW